MNPIKPKVLIIPAWYPATFFVEQMELLKDEFDFKVIVGNRTELGRKVALKRLIFGKLKFFDWENKKAQIDEIKISFSWVNHLPRYIERKQYNFLNKCFEKELDSLRKEGWAPDLIHIQSISDTSVFLKNWAVKNRIPIILTEHIIYIRSRFDFFQKEKEKVYSCANKVLCVSNYVYRNLLTTGFKLRNASIIGNFVDDRYTPTEFNRSKSNNRILFVASHLSDKDIDVLFKSLNILIESGSNDFELHIIGLEPDKIYIIDGEEEFSLTKEIEKYKLSEYIKIIGPISKKQLLESYKNYSFLVSTSLSETFGLAIAEAILNGLPVVCTDSGGIRDFVDEKNGIIVSIRNPQLFSEAIKEMMLNVDRYDYKTISDAIKIKFGKEAFTRKLLYEYHLAL